MRMRITLFLAGTLLSVASVAGANAQIAADPAYAVTFVEAEGQWAFTLTWDPPQIWDMDAPRDVSTCGPDCIQSPFAATRSLPEFGPERRTGSRMRRGNVGFEYLGLETLSHCGEETEVHTVMGHVDPGREGQHDPDLVTRSYYTQDGTLIGYTMVNWPENSPLSATWLIACDELESLTPP